MVLPEGIQISNPESQITKLLTFRNRLAQPGHTIGPSAFRMVARAQRATASRRSRMKREFGEFDPFLFGILDLNSHREVHVWNMNSYIKH